MHPNQLIRRHSRSHSLLRLGRTGSSLQLGIRMGHMYNEAQKNNDKLKVPAKAQLAERIQAEALCQYLNILYIPVLYSTRPHTVEYLNDFDYSRSSSYGILHGMILERCGKIDELYGEMEKLFEKTDNVVVQYLIRKIMQHSIVFSKKISQAQIQRIEEKFLDGGKGHQKRLVARKFKQ